MKKFFHKIVGFLKNNGEHIDADEKSHVDPFQEVVKPQEPSKSAENTVIDEECVAPLSPETVELSNTFSNPQQKVRATNRDRIIPEKVEDTVELEEFTVTALMRSLSPFFHGKFTVESLHFHLRSNREHINSKACENLFYQNDFVEKLKVHFANNGIGYVENLSIKITYASPHLDSYTPITTFLSVEVQALGQSKREIKAIVSAVSGILWDTTIEITPNDTPCYIGRCRNPKLPNGLTINNKIAFIGAEEVLAKNYEINRFVSRSIACIIYNEKTNEFELMRSNLMENSQHIIKIIRITQKGVEEILLNNSYVKYPLKDNDQITFNNKVSLSIKISETNTLFV